jgi:hypothetical protein
MFLKGVNSPKHCNISNATLVTIGDMLLKWYQDSEEHDHSRTVQSIATLEAESAQSYIAHTHLVKYMETCDIYFWIVLDVFIDGILGSPLP